MNNDLMFSSNNQQWATRLEVYNQIKEYTGGWFDLDPCAEKHTVKCDRFFTKEQNMFNKNLDWGVDAGQFAGGYFKSTVFMNPEYGREQPKFVKELIKRIKDEQVEKGICLIPARTDTKLFHETILKNASKITFYDGRLVFGTDEYWEFVWSEPTMINLNGKDKPNTLFNKVGKFNSAPFPSMIVEFISELKGNPTIATLKAPKFKYNK